MGKSTIWNQMAESIAFKDNCYALIASLLKANSQKETIHIAHELFNCLTGLFCL